MHLVLLVHISDMWDVRIWLLREVVALSLMIFFAMPLHDLSSHIWDKFTRKVGRVNHPRLTNSFLMAVAVQMILVCVYFLIIIL